MTWRTRTLFLFLAVVFLLLARLGETTYRWVAHAEERQELRVLTAALDSAGLSVMLTQLRADSLRGVLLRLDGELATERRALVRLESRGMGGGLSRDTYAVYLGRVEDYNRNVGERNSDYERWKAVVEGNHRAVRRYNVLADSIRALASRIGEPYFAIPSPAELAVRHGLVPVSRRHAAREGPE